MTTKKLLNEIIGCAKEKKAEDILALDVSNNLLLEDQISAASPTTLDEYTTL